jgi:uncharacterized protein (TIGR02453 family)
VTFTGFGEDLPLFFEGLEADNSKAYWADHKPVYDEQVRGPLEDLLADLAPEFGEAKVFRPYRDVRFAKDKSPYKTHTAGHTHGRGGHGALYVQVDAAGLMVAGGYWRMERDQLARYRAAVADDGTGPVAVRLVRSLERDGWEPASVVEQLARAPRGYPADHPRVDLLRRKGLAMARRLPLEPWLHEPAAAQVVAEHWRALAPLNRWLDRHVGPPVPAANERDEAARS